MMENSNVTWTKNRIVFLILCCFGLLSFISIQFPDVRLLIISFTENYFLHRQLEDPSKWHRKMVFWSNCGILFFSIMFFIVLLMKIFKEQLRKILVKMKLINSLSDAISYVSTINYKQFIKPVLIMFFIYIIGFTAIIRADFSYVDDLLRSRSGYRGWENWSRHLSSFLAVFFHADIWISDISPLTQLIAAFFIAVASVVLVYVVNDNKITNIALAASIPVGLSPYFLECFSYKFDSPYMALSVLASIIPFVFINNKLVFSVSSIIGILIMCMTYQASSGIYVIIVIFLCFYYWNTQNKTNLENLIFLGVSIFSYCIGMLLFRIFFMVPKDAIGAYASTSFFSISQIVPGFISNIIKYFNYVISDFSLIWKVILILLVISFFIENIIITRQYKLISLIIGFFVIILMGILSFGVYLLLTKPIYVPRGMYGFGIFIAILGISSARIPKKLFTLPALALSWCFFIFSFSYGNVLVAQKKYMEFRTEMLIHDLAVLFPERKENNLPIKIVGEGGKTPVFSNVAARNPIIYRLVPDYLGNRGTWNEDSLMYHYNIKIYFISENIDIEEPEFEQIFNSMYHTIKTDGERVIIILK